MKDYTGEDIDMFIYFWGKRMPTFELALRRMAWGTYRKDVNSTARQIRRYILQADKPAKEDMLDKYLYLYDSAQFEQALTIGYCKYLVNRWR